MDTALWIAAAFLAAASLGAAALKGLRSYASLAADPNTAWVKGFPPAAVKAIAAAELLGALGLVLPQATGIAEVLTPIAALGIACIQLGATNVHIRLREYRIVPVNLVLLALAVFVASGRF